MRQKLPPPPAQPPRASAPHIQAAVRAVQAKFAERPASQGRPLRPQASAPVQSSPQAVHVRNALAAVQAKLPGPSVQSHGPAPQAPAAVRQEAQQKLLVRPPVLVIQRKKEDAEAYVRDNDVKMSSEINKIGVESYIEDDRNPMDYRVGLYLAWNKDQTARYILDPPRDDEFRSALNEAQGVDGGEGPRTRGRSKSGAAERQRLRSRSPQARSSSPSLRSEEGQAPKREVAVEPRRPKRVKAADGFDATDKIAGVLRDLPYPIGSAALQGGGKAAKYKVGAVVWVEDEEVGEGTYDSGSMYHAEMIALDEALGKNTN